MYKLHHLLILITLLELEFTFPEVPDPGRKIPWRMNVTLIPSAFIYLRILPCFVANESLGVIGWYI